MCVHVFMCLAAYAYAHERISVHMRAYECICACLFMGLAAHMQDGSTALVEAVWWKRRDVVDLLLSRGADVHKAKAVGGDGSSFSGWSGVG